LGGTFGNIVEWSNTETGEIENVTRKEMCKRQSGVIHWTKKVRQRARESNEPNGRCQDRLYMLDQMKQESFKREEKMEARHFPGRKVVMLAEVLGHSHDGGYLPS